MPPRHKRLTFAGGTLGRFIRRHGIELRSKGVDPDVIGHRHNPGASHFLLTLSRPYSDNLLVPYSRGSAYRGRPPALDEVLQSLAADALLYYEVGDAQTYADAFTIEPEDMEEEFELLKQITLSLEKFLGPQAFGELMNMIQNNPELSGAVQQMMRRFVA